MQLHLHFIVPILTAKHLGKEILIFWNQMHICEIKANLWNHRPIIGQPVKQLRATACSDLLSVSLLTAPIFWKTSFFRNVVLKSHHFRIILYISQSCCSTKIGVLLTKIWTLRILCDDGHDPFKCFVHLGTCDPEWVPG